MVVIKNIVFKELKKLDSCQSSEIFKMLFQVITYIERYKNSTGEVILTKSLVLEKFNIRKTDRNLSRVSKTINFLISIDIISLCGRDDLKNIKNDSLIEIKIKKDERVFRKHDDLFIDELIHYIKENNEKYDCGLVFYYIAYQIKYYSQGAGYTDVRLSYQDIVKGTGIGSRNTIGKYVRFLEKGKFIKSKTIKKGGVDKDGKELKEVYKIYSMPDRNNKQ